MSKSRLLAAGPWVFADWCVPHRAVLRRLDFAAVGFGGVKEVGVEYVTHVECAHENGKRGYDQGHYFQSDWLAASKDFAKRVERTLNGCSAVVTEEEVIAWVAERKGGEDGVREEGQN